MKPLRCRIRYPFLALTLLLAASLACVINVGGPETPEARVPISTEAVESLDTLWQTALDVEAETGKISLVVNESQVTSLLAFRLQAEEDPLISDPQVYLDEGQVQIFGTATQSNLVATVRIVLSVDVSADGVPQLILETADFGPLPIPESLLTGLSAMLDEAFTGSVGPAATGFRIESIMIDDGLMAITGRIR